MANFGCGGAPADQPDLGRVSGTITLDGQPLASAYVTFTPSEGRPSSAQTNEGGDYVLTYTADAKGAKIGQHKVDIRTVPDGDPNVAAEKVPAKYNQSSELTATVQAGSNKINFDLQSM